MTLPGEKAAFRLYTDLAAKTDDPELQKLLLDLAQEEAKHKLRFEEQQTRIGATITCSYCFTDPITTSFKF